MIVYTGNGPLAFAAVFFPIVLLLIHKVIEDQLGPHPAFAVSRLLVFLAGSALAGAWCWWYGRRCNKDGNVHTVYGIPFQYFAFGYWGFGLFLVITAVWHWLGKDPAG
ncbi:hypothetical protein AYO44_08085 [Planctomycetaceae bacterium SCGC AG-212-F19]|nr:hypothetical protein AYO44_08085 [Planctomycetaceae bacterium SCGC AG-212-F19]